MGRLTGWMTDRRTDGKFHFISTSAWKASFHPEASRPRRCWGMDESNDEWKKLHFITTTPDDHAWRPRCPYSGPIGLLHHVANREAFHPFFFPSPLLHLGSMWQRVDIYSMESGDSFTNIRVYAIVSTSLKLANWCWPWNTTHYIVLIAALVLSI